MASVGARIGVAGVLLAGALAALYFYSRPAANPAPGRAEAKPQPLEFSRTGLSEKIVHAVEDMVRPREAAAAVCETQNGRFAYVLVEGTGEEKFFELDTDLSVANFPFLKQHGFAAPPLQVSRTMSRYRSVSKAAMQFDMANDRMIV